MNLGLQLFFLLARIGQLLGLQSPIITLGLNWITFGSLIMNFGLQILGLRLLLLAQIGQLLGLLYLIITLDLNWMTFGSLIMNLGLQILGLRLILLA